MEERAAFLLLPAPHDGNTHIWNQYTVRVVPGRGWVRPETPRDALRSFLQERGIGSEIYYPRPMHQQECFAYAGPHAALPVCERLARESVSLPVFPELTAEEQDATIAALADFLAQNR
jgi:dTDP-4-amino-4,6-dideoxygalactose transaminase